MDVREVELPGVGMKFSFEKEDGETLSVVIHKTGKREIFRFLSGSETPDSAIELSDEEARELGAILIGTHFQPDVEDTARLVMKELTLEWLKVADESPLVNKTIQEKLVRKATGATIIAVLGSQRRVLNPGPDTRIEAGDLLVVVGDEAQVRRFKQEFGID